MSIGDPPGLCRLWLHRHAPRHTAVMAAEKENDMHIPWHTDDDFLRRRAEDLTIDRPVAASDVVRLAKRFLQLTDPPETEDAKDAEPDSFECVSCSALVADLAKHNDWHKAVAAEIQQAQFPRPLGGFDWSKMGGGIAPGGPPGWLTNMAERLADLATKADDK